MKRQFPNDLDDKTLDALLATYRIAIDTGDAAIDAMARAARIKAVRMKDAAAQHGFFGLVAEIFGLRRASSAAWSALAGMAFAGLLGLSLGLNDGLQIGPETAFSIDFDSVIGSGTLAAPAQVEQD